MFSATRLSVARKRRQFTKKALATKANISQLTLTRIENGETTEPEESTVGAIAKALSYPMEFFYLDDCEELPVEAVSFRSLTSLTARQRDAALAAGSLALSLDQWVSERFNLPAPDLVDLREESPIAAAAALRSHWGIGSRPVKHMTQLLEAKGVRVFSLCERNKNVDAFSCWRSEKPYVFLNTFKSSERSRFDAAHELGHLVMHRHGDACSRDVEREADQFASAFLIPMGDLLGQVSGIINLKLLISAKERWGVSVAALARSAYEGRLISEWHYRDISKQISINGYRSKEPNGRPREGSVVWRKVFEALWSERLTKEHVARQLCLPMDELEAIIGGFNGQDVSGDQIRSQKPLLRVV